MRKSLNIRGMELGAGKPKVCVPVTGKTEEEILKETDLAKESGADLIEWRADYYLGVENPDKVAELARKMREHLNDMPILFTYRTEGCSNSISPSVYIELNKRMAREGSVDLIDVELFMGDEMCRDFCEYAHAQGCYVIISSHDFERTPNAQEIIERLCKMRTLGADVPKVAVMPNNAEDVLTLLSATNQYANVYADGPLVTMSMNRLGQISRVCGEIFGSALTFGSTLRVSAPGQLHIDDLKNILDVLHEH